MSKSLTQIKDVQDKTTLRGVYLFLSIVISLLIFKYFLKIDIVSYLTTEPPLSLYISILSLATVIAATLYYIQPNMLLLEKVFKLSIFREKFPSYNGIDLSNSIEHPFISTERTRFGSKLFFISTLGLSIFLFIGENINILIGISIFMVSLVITLFILMRRDLNNLILRVKMIYFMKLFIRENNLYKNSKDNVVKEFTLNLQRTLWFEAKASFSYFLDNYLSEISEPFQNKLKHSNIIEKFYETIFIFYNDSSFNNKPNHEIVTYFFDKMNLDISVGTNKSDRYILDYIKPILESYEYIKEFTEKLILWDNWLKAYIFKEEYIELSKVLNQIDEIINCFDKNGHYNKLKAQHIQINKNDITSIQINIIKKEIHIQYQKIIKNFTDIHHTLQLKNITDFFKSDLMKEYLEKIRNKRYFLDLELKIRERLTKENYQNVFSTITILLEFYIKNYPLAPYEYQKIDIFHHIKILQKYKYDLDKIDILADFSKPYQISLIISSDLELIFPFKQEGLFHKKIKDLRTKNPLPDLEIQKEKIYNFLNLLSRKFNLQIDNIEFWKN